MQLSLAYSPCPNDTYMFHSLISDATYRDNYELSVSLADIAALNRAAIAATYDITKLSFASYFQVEDTYQALPTGTAMGHGCGPLVISKTPSRDISGGKVALPGKNTTAHLLFDLWLAADIQKVYLPYDQIMPQLLAGKIDYGVIIHESRFTYQELGLFELIDLGQWWEKKTSLPIPLGCIAIKRSLGPEIFATFARNLQASITSASWQNPALRAYVHSHAQELSAEVLQQHIGTYVNGYSLRLGAKGTQAIETLRKLAVQREVTL